MSGIVYKQRYKARGQANAAGLNVRHLQYIATRPGAIYNTGCGFGLWGHLPGDEGVRIQQDLTWAKQLVRQASREHTLYRGTLSVGNKDAMEKGLYSRERWEQLVNDHIDVIARENDIKPQNLCWVASMHYAKGHPHVHLLFWDNGSGPQPEFVPEAKFEARMERIRAEFSGDLFREEIRQEQQEQREDTKILRSMLRSVCLEANPGKALNIPKLFQGKELSILSQGLLELIRSVPQTGSLRYAYLQPEYKEKVDAFVELCLEQVPELSREDARYEAHTRRISELYSNGEVGADEALDKARKKLRTELGNQVMATVRRSLEELREAPPEDRSQTRTFIRDTSREILPTMESYRELRELLPRERIPVGRMNQQIPGYFEQMNKVLGEMLSDARVRVKLQGWARKEAGIQSGDPSAASEEQRQAYQDAYREAKRDLRREITEQLRQDAGWTEELARTRTVVMACEMLRLVSQLASQKEAALNQGRLNSKRRSRNMSREERQHNRAVRSQGSSWDFD